MSNTAPHTAKCVTQFALRNLRNKNYSSIFATMSLNPFVLNHYRSPAYFCNREEETAEIIDAIEQHRSITLHSIRRMGKTALIKHVFYKLQRKRNHHLIYLDILDLTNAADFANSLSSAMIASLEQSKEGFIKKATKYFGKYRPVFSVDTLSGAPSLALDIRNEPDIQFSLDTVFSFIAKEKKTFVIAIDEFQQVNNFDIKTIPATLRRFLQQYPNLVFIFSGSQRNMLLELMTSPKHALYRSTQLISLDRISDTSYAKFIRRHYAKEGRKINDDIINDGLDWTMRHTHYTHWYFHRLWTLAPTLNRQAVEQIKNQILLDNQSVFLNYRNLMTSPQWKLLVAIAKETQIQAPTAKAFLKKHNLGAASTVQRSLNFLLTSEMIYQEYLNKKEKPFYRVYDVFLSRWLED